MNILIGIPSKDKIEIETAISIANLDWDGHSITYTHADGAGVYGIAQARNRLVQKAIDGGYDKLFMIDSDMIVPEDAIINLLDPDEPIVIGVARYKNDSGRAPIFKGVQDETGSDAWRWDQIPYGRFTFQSGGVACAMIDMSVFDTIPRPWFKWREMNNGAYLGEDIYFYERARAAGYTPKADGRVRCGHIGRKIYD